MTKLAGIAKATSAVPIKVLNKKEILMDGDFLSFSTESVDNSVDCFCNPTVRHEFS